MSHRRPARPLAALAALFLVLSAIPLGNPLAIAAVRPDTGSAVHVPIVPAVTSVRIRDIQGAAHISPLDGEAVSNVEGVVTAVRSSGFWFQDPDPDTDVATSEGIFVFTRSTPTVTLGDAVTVSGTVSEFRPGGAATINLTTTQIGSPTVVVRSSGNPLPAPIVIGAGGRTPPPKVIDDDATGSVETSGSFDAATDGIDFWESLEGMRVTIADAVGVGPRTGFGEIAVISDGTGAVRTSRGGIVIRPNDFNPERVLLDDVLANVPMANVGDAFTNVVGILDYSFGMFKLLVTQTPGVIAGGITREVTRAPFDYEIAVAGFNVENLHPGNPPAKFAELAGIIVNNLRSPDLVALQEVQDNSGPTDDGTTDASLSAAMLIAAIAAAGGPTYQYRDIAPKDGQDGGQPGGNIRVAFLFRDDRGLTFIDRPGGDATTATTVVSTPAGPQLSASPGRVDPTNDAWDESRKPLAGEFRMHGKKVFVIVNHFSSKFGDDPLFGWRQPTVRSSEVARHQQAAVVNGFLDQILAADPNANVIVLGDINDFQFSVTVDILKGGVLDDLVDELPLEERYTYVFEGNSQVLDHILLSGNLFTHFRFEYDVVHVNSEFADQASDHEPEVVRLDLRGRPAPRRPGLVWPLPRSVVADAARTSRR
ncbi:MAG: endonuclease/exonuclease/phosphatase family protein [Candidatus Limnocylindria bacterium]